MQAVQDRAHAILEGLAVTLPNDALTARALFLAGVAAMYEVGITRDELVRMAEGDWDVVDEALQAARPEPHVCGPGCGTLVLFDLTTPLIQH